MRIAAIVAVALLAVVTVFQIALALGAPLGQAAWGGRHPGVLPTRLRVASGVAAVVVYPLIMVVVLAAAGLIGGDWLPGTGQVVMWALTGLFALGALMNLVSRSKAERLWGPVVGVIAVCCAILAATL
jgi:FtsH-binding integral membrane protein